jgi:hypothetical protein
LGRVKATNQFTHDKEEDMALIKKPPETIERHIRLEEPVSQLLDDYCRFVDCTADYVTNFALRKMLSRDPEYKKWKASQSPLPAARTGAASSPNPRLA